jgi:hypothetical protein
MFFLSLFAFHIKLISRFMIYSYLFIYLFLFDLVHKVSIYLKNWSYVLSYVSKVESAIGSIDNKEDTAILCKAKCAAGLAELNCKRYKSAAKYFLAATFDGFNYSDVC